MRSEQTLLNRQRYQVLIASCFINLCVGSMYAWSVFAVPLASKLSALSGTTITASTLAIVFTVANAVGTITMISGGAINDRLGPRWVVLLGGALFGSGMLLSARATSIMGLIFAYGILLGLGVGLVYGCTISNTIKFFPDKRGLAGGLTAATYGLSSVLVPPVADRLVNSIGVTDTMTILGIFFLIVICSGAFLLRACPPGYHPDKTVLQLASREEEYGLTTREMLSTSVFYVMIAMLVAGAFSGLMMISQASPIAQNMIGMTSGAASATVSALALFNAAGRVLSGYISDRLGRVTTLAIVYMLCLTGCLLLFFSKPSTAWLFVFGICVIGFCFGSLMAIFPSFSIEQFGSKHSSVNYGVMFIGFAFAGIIGPQTASLLYASTASYRPAFLVSGLFSIIGFLLCVFYAYKFGRRRVTEAA